MTRGLLLVVGAKLPEENAKRIGAWFAEGCPGTLVVEVGSLDARLMFLDLSGKVLADTAEGGPVLVLDGLGVDREAGDAVEAARRFGATNACVSAMLEAAASAPKAPGGAA